jgi:superkiller protein 3
VTALASYLPTSDFYPVLSLLPPPDATNPDTTTTFAAQCAIQDSLPIIQEIVQILEKYEDTTFTQEVDNRRKRLGAPSQDVIRQEVGYEVWSQSRVRVSLVCPDLLMTSRW